MSSPNMAGGIALLLSGLQQQRRVWSVDAVRRALTSTARSLPNMDAFGGGAGVAQLVPAYRWLLASLPTADDVVAVALAAHWLDVQLSGDAITQSSSDVARGIYLRSPNETSRVHVFSVAVNVRFPDWVNSDVQCRFERRLRVHCAAAWVDVPVNYIIIITIVLFAFLSLSII